MITTHGTDNSQIEKMKEDFLKFCNENNGKLTEIGTEDLLCKFDVPLEISELTLDGNELEIHVVKSKTPKERLSRMYRINLLEDDASISINPYYQKIDEILLDRRMDLYEIGGDFLIREARFVKRRGDRFTASTEINLE